MIQSTDRRGVPTRTARLLFPPVYNKSVYLTKRPKRISDLHSDPFSTVSRKVRPNWFAVVVVDVSHVHRRYVLASAYYNIMTFCFPAFSLLFKCLFPFRALTECCLLRFHPIKLRVQTTVEFRKKTLKTVSATGLTWSLAACRKRNHEFTKHQEKKRLYFEFHFIFFGNFNHIFTLKQSFS